MRDADKPREKLIAELTDLRQRVAELESECIRLKQWRPVRIGEILMEMGYVTRPQLGDAVRKQKEAYMWGESHTRIGKILVNSQVITEEQLNGALAQQRTRLSLQFQ